MSKILDSAVSLFEDERISNELKGRMMTAISRVQKVQDVQSLREVLIVMLDLLDEAERVDGVK